MQNIIFESTDTTNLELKNIRYYRNFWQTNFPSLYACLGYNLDEPQYHTSSSHLFFRHIERLHCFKQNHPILAYFIQSAIPLVLLASIPFVWTIFPNLVSLGSCLLAVQIAITATTSILALISYVSKWLGDHLFGESIAPFASIYDQDSLIRLTKLLINNPKSPNDFTVLQYNMSSFIQAKYKNSKAKLTINPQGMPKLTIQAKNPKEAGYLEGYMQGEQIEATIKNINYLYNKIKIFIGAPNNDKDLKEYLSAIEKKIPKDYVSEMKAKVKGFNQWRKDSGLDTSENLEYYKYLLLQLLPDAHHFNPFNQKQRAMHSTSELPQAIAGGCTTVAVKIDEFTCYLRVLDWPAYGIAGKGFIQLERQIEGRKTTTDIGLGLLSGCVSVVNQNQVLTQINVSRVEKVGPQGMPGAFFIRYLSENSSNIDEMTELLREYSPLSGMHVTATDGNKTMSYHAYQGPDKGHIIETLGERPLVVANFGYDHTIKRIVDHHDSSARLENINHFFKANPKTEVLTHGDIEEKKISDLCTYMSKIMKLNLVNNTESVFAGIYIYKGHQLLKCSAAVDNILAGNRTLSQMAKLH